MTTDFSSPLPGPREHTVRPGGDRLSSTQAWIVIGALAAVVVLDTGFLGRDPWPFHVGHIKPHGPLAFLVRLAQSRWDIGVLRSLAMLGGVGVVALAVAACLVRRWRPWVLVASSVVVLAALLVPAVALQVGLRQASEPWFYVNDSTYQIELAGELVLHGETPYGHDYAESGLARFYTLDGSMPPPARRPHVGLHHFAYFPGIALLGAAWRVLPAPWDDLRWLTMLATLGLVGAAMLFPGPPEARLALGIVAAGNPIVERAAWFGTADAPTLLLLMLAFALLLRRRDGWAAAALAAAILSKQFALVAVPFFAASWLGRASPGGRRKPLLVFLGVLAVGFIPFLAADAGALWHDAGSYGASTYPIVGYGLPELLVRTHLIANRNAAYPFFPLVALVWLPVTAVLVWGQLRAGRQWLAGAGFTTSVFLLLFLGRVFQISYLAYPLTGLVLTALLATSGHGPSAEATLAPRVAATAPVRPISAPVIVSSKKAP